MALLVTGRTLDEMRGEEFEVAREQVFSYLAGRVGLQTWTRPGTSHGTHRGAIEPNLIANEAVPERPSDDWPGPHRRPEARLLDGPFQQQRSDLGCRYDVTRRFQTRGVRQRTTAIGFDFRHDVRFGGQPAPGRLPRHRPTVSQTGGDLSDSGVDEA